MMTETQKADRLALIKTVHDKIQAKKAFKSKVQTKTRSVFVSTDRAERKDLYKDNLNRFYNAIDKMDENHNQWTDASKYANEYYGETMRETTKFDNDWG